MAKITNKFMLLAAIFLFAGTTCVAAPGGPPPPAPPPPPGLPIDSNILLLLSISILYVIYKLQFNNKKASI